MPFNEHACCQVAAGKASLTDLTPDDIEAIVSFWYDGGADHDYLGIDPLLLGERDDTRRRFQNAIRTGDQAQQNIAFAIRLGQELIGYTLLNRYTPQINYSHWHIIKPELRGTGISTALYPYRIDMYFKLFPLTRLIHQTRARNIAVNRMLDKYVPIAETCYVIHPDGVALPGEFHIRYVSAEQIPGVFKKVGEV